MYFICLYPHPSPFARSREFLNDVLLCFFVFLVLDTAPSAATSIVSRQRRGRQTRTRNPNPAPTRGGRKGQNPSLSWCASPAPAPKVVTLNAVTSPVAVAAFVASPAPANKEGANDQSSAQGRGGSGGSVAGPDQGGGPDPDGFEGGSERTFMGQVATTLAEATPWRHVTN